MLSTAKRYYHTLKYLRPIQIYGQLLFRLKKTKINFSLPPNQRKLQVNWTTPILKSTLRFSENKITLLNQSKDISESSIWNDRSVDKLWLYHLHYFDVLNSATIPRDQSILIKRWIKENPPSYGCGWESYPLSLRIVNWIKWFLSGYSPETEMLHSLAIQIRYLYKRTEINILGNHLLANAKALIFAGLFFEGREPIKWLAKGLKIFNQQITEQILPDGGHFELSPMYHSIILEDLLDILNIYQACGYLFPAHWLTVCNKMFYWLKVMCHADENISFFNDATLEVAPTLSILKQYQNRLSLHISESIKMKPVIYLASSGYCRIQFNKVLLLADVSEMKASYQPGHAHADTLSFELSIAKQRLIVNSGISHYTYNSERLKQRGTHAHNTIVVDNQNSSEIWKSFRVGRRAKIREVKIKEFKDKILLTASHDGYYHINKIIHQRTWQMTENELLIIDHLSGSGYHKIELCFHIHPDIKIIDSTENYLLFLDQAENLLASLQVNQCLKLCDSTYHPAFNKTISNKKIIIEINQTLPLSVNTIIKWNL